MDTIWLWTLVQTVKRRRQVHVHSHGSTSKTNSLIKNKKKIWKIHTESLGWVYLGNGIVGGGKGEGEVFLHLYASVLQDLLSMRWHHFCKQKSQICRWRCGVSDRGRWRRKLSRLTQSPASHYRVCVWGARSCHVSMALCDHNARAWAGAVEGTGLFSVQV